MNFLKLVQDTLYWIEQSPSSFLFSENGFCVKEPPFEEKVERKSLPVKRALPIIPPKKEEKVEKEPQVVQELEKTPSIAPKTRKIPSAEITAYLSQYYPSFRLVSSPKKDSLAQKIKEAYLYKNQAAEVTILLFEKKEKDLLFLQNLAKAIDTYFFPCKVVEEPKDMNWESFLEAKNLKLILASDYALWQETSLRNFFREIPGEGKRFLKNTPLFLLPDLSLYYKDPLLKCSLWKSLCQILPCL